ncbi:SGNH/GDSL hydrolase family protein [Micromonosporaceae bacterium DT55]|uniref:SGNH/GDSL hydrolase family protein n=1 Tax=Melissospora conviva TaxID=3388432 RepID=UPI003C1D509B
MRWRSYVAVGDSFSEGMDDPYPDGTYRGWADLVATRLAAEAGPDFGYANLAIRGKLFGHVVDDQVPVALEMKPDLISFAAGGNDALRPGLDIAAIARRLDTAVAEMRAGGTDVVLFRYANVMARLPGNRWVTPKVVQMNTVVGEAAQKHGAILVDLYSDDTFLNPLLWGPDRLHLSPAGHRRVAAQVLTALGVGCDEEWLLVPPHPEPTPWLSARTADLRWAGKHLAPWVKRRLTGRSSGDTVTAKRPTLSPLTD